MSQKREISKFENQEQGLEERIKWYQEWWIYENEKLFGGKIYSISWKEKEGMPCDWLSSICFIQFK